jgi:hypothetical protein
MYERVHAGLGGHGKGQNSLDGSAYRPNWKREILQDSQAVRRDPGTVQRSAGA